MKALALTLLSLCSLNAFAVSLMPPCGDHAQRAAAHLAKISFPGDLVNIVNGDLDGKHQLRLISRNGNNVCWRVEVAGSQEGLAYVVNAEKNAGACTITRIELVGSPQD